MHCWHFQQAKISYFIMPFYLPGCIPLPSKELLLTNGGSNPCWILDYYNIRSSAEVVQNVKLKTAVLLEPRQRLFSNTKRTPFYHQLNFLICFHLGDEKRKTMFLHHRRYQFSSGYFIPYKRKVVLSLPGLILDITKISLLPFLMEVEEVRILNF